MASNATSILNVQENDSIIVPRKQAAVPRDMVSDQGIMKCIRGQSVHDMKEKNGSHSVTILTAMPRERNSRRGLCLVFGRNDVQIPGQQVLVKLETNCHRIWADGYLTEDLHRIDSAA